MGKAWKDADCTEKIVVLPYQGNDRDFTRDNNDQIPRNMGIEWDFYIADLCIYMITYIYIYTIYTVYTYECIYIYIYIYTVLANLGWGMVLLGQVHERMFD